LFIISTRLEGKTMATLLTQLTNHDWFHEYSDDHRVWQRGHARQAELKAELDRLNCPFTMRDIRMSVQKMILDEFAEEKPGQWYRQPKLYKNVAPTGRPGLIERSNAEEIMIWLERQDSEA
jgi:hypothetical protein